MGKKKKNKVKQLTRDEMASNLHFEVEENSYEIFKKYIDETDWKQCQKKEEDQEDKPNIKGKVAKKTSAALKKKHVIDLHGFSLEEAKLELIKLISHLIGQNKSILQLNIITGKGRHSGPEGAKLIREIPIYVSKKWKQHIVSIEDSPADLTINGRPIRGHFTVLLK